jgi:peroxiredoxin (alkyl hydroperoxide reductase subunit C)
MVSPNQPSLHEVDWSKIPAPEDDGGARHLTGLAVPDVVLPATDGTPVSLARIPGRVVVFAYPRTGVPGQISPVPEWDTIPGARGCTPHACGFRDLHRDLAAAGVARVFGLSTQDTAYQREAAERLHLPFPILSDEQLALAAALRLPLMQVGGMTLNRRLALVIDDGTIAKVFYPVFPPDRNAGDVLAWLQQNPRK